MVHAGVPGTEEIALFRYHLSGIGENIHEEYLEKSELENFLFLLFSCFFCGEGLFERERGRCWGFWHTSPALYCGLNDTTQ